MRHAFRKLLCAVAGFAWPVAASFGQSAAPSSEQPPPVRETSSRNPTASQDKQDSVAEAARKARERETAAAKRKVFTEDDLSGLKGGVSVVGTENKKLVQSSPSKAEDAEGAQSGEAHWRGKAQPILQEMGEIDRLMTRLKEDIKKYGSAGIDVASGLRDGVAYVRDRNAQIQELQRKESRFATEVGRAGGGGPQSGSPTRVVSLMRPGSGLTLQIVVSN